MWIILRVLTVSYHKGRYNSRPCKEASGKGTLRCRSCKFFLNLSLLAGPSDVHGSLCREGGRINKAMKDQQSLRSGWLYRVRPRNRWWKLLEQAPALPCLLLLLSLSSPSLAQVSEYDCVYTNSTSPPCSSVCLQTCFYSLLPARCSPEGTVS